MDASEVVHRINHITQQYAGVLSLETDTGVICTGVSINKDNVVILKFEEKPIPKEENNV
jgi:hypothetical protein